MKKWTRVAKAAFPIFLNKFFLEWAIFLEYIISFSSCKKLSPSFCASSYTYQIENINEPIKLNKSSPAVSPFK